MKLVLAFMAILVAQSWAEFGEVEDEDMVILEGPRVTRDSEDGDAEEESSREGRQFFWGMGPQYPGGFIHHQRHWRYPAGTSPFIPAVTSPFVPVAGAVSQGQCYTSKGASGQCTTYQNCGNYGLFEALPKDLPSWALGTKDQCIIQNSQADRMGYVSTYGICCPSGSLTSPQSRVPKPPSKNRQWGGLYPAGAQPLYPGQGFQQPGGFPFGGFGGQPQQPPPGFGGGYPQGPPQGPPGFGGQPQGPPPGFGGQPQGPPPGFGGGSPQGPPQGPPPGFGGQPQQPPPQGPPPQVTQPDPVQPVQEVAAPAPAPVEQQEITSVDDDTSSSDGTDYSICGQGRNPIKYNADGEEVEQVERAKPDAQHPLRVAGGWPADRNEWPWVVMMMNRGNQFCDGSIIDEWHILTAAHCVAQMRSSDVTTLTVRMGAHNLKNSAREAGVQNHGVKLVVKHKDFTMETLHSDIAILVLKTPIKYTATVRPVCLPSSDQSYAKKKGTVVGWGLLREGGSRPVTLMELTMEIWDNDKCKSTYGSTAPAGITDTMLCAGKKGKDSCSGDSGGPFVTPVGDHWEQIGVVSWGIGCGKQHYPGVYTRVSKMMEWIDKVRGLYPGGE